MLTRVFQVGADVTTFRSAVLDVDDDIARAWCTAVMPGGRTSFDGSLVAERWRPPDLRWWDQSGRVGDTVDVALYGGAVTISHRAEDVLRPFLEGCELLPVTIDRTAWTVVNPTVMIDCVDPSLSEYYAFVEDDGSPALRTPGFDLGAAEVKGLFRTPQQPVRVLCSSTREDPWNGFRGAVEANGLLGFSFREMRTAATPGATGPPTPPWMDAE